MKDVVAGILIFLLMMVAVWIILSTFNDLMGFLAGICVWVIMALAGIL